jgi:hypothetical protein
LILSRIAKDSTITSIETAADCSLGFLDLGI